MRFVGLTHAGVRTLAILSRPSHVGRVLFAGWSSLLLWAMALIPTWYAIPPGWSNWYAWGFSLLPFWLWPGTIMPLVSGLNPADPSRSKPLPALPIGPRQRLVAEALAALGLVVSVRLLTVGFVSLLVAPFDPLQGQHIGFGQILRELGRSQSGALFCLPLLLAWAAPARSRGVYFARSLLVAVVTLATPTLLVAPSPTWVRLLCGTLAGLAALVCLGSGFGAPWRSPFRRRSRPPGPCWRPGLPGETRLARDHRIGLGRALLSSLVPGFVCLTASSVLHAHAGGSNHLRLLALALWVAAIGLAVKAYARPLGIHLLPTQWSAGSGTLLSGAFLRAWRHLPVPPEVVTRGVYLHGLLCAAGVWLLLAYSDVLAVPPQYWRFKLFLGLAALTGAGLALCAAVGDRHLGMLVASSLLLYPAAMVGVPYLRLSHGLSKHDLVGLDVAVFALLFLVGAVLPLARLRPSQ